MTVMIQRFSHGPVTWLDIVNPTTEEIRDVFSECKLPPEFSGDLTSMTPRTEVRSSKNAIKLTLDFPTVKRTDITHPHEIKFIATKKHLVTIRFEDIEEIHQFAKEFEVSSVLTAAGKKATGQHFMLALLSALYNGLNSKLDYLESKMQQVEQNIFENDEKEMLFEISQISRRLITFRHTVTTHEEVLDKLKTAVDEAFGSKNISKVEELELTYTHLMRRASALVNIVDNLRDTNDALLNAKQNEVMKTLTIMAFITFPLTLFTSLFGMNTQTTPIVGTQNDFWFIVGIMIIVSIGFFGFFKYKKWM